MTSLQCYSKINSTISATQGKPCGAPNSTHPYVPCCSSGDTCMSNGLCFFSQSKVGGSGYYASGCTDAKYNAGSCPDLCNDQGRLDVVYNTSSQVWSCCGGTSKQINCGNPTKENFGAPAPGDLLAYFVAGKNSSALSSTFSTSATSSPTAKNSGDSGSGLSPGAAGGLGAGIAVVVLLLIGVVAFFGILRRRRRRRTILTDTFGDGSGMSTPTRETTMLNPLSSNTEASKERAKAGLYEMDTHHLVEAPSRDHPPQELPGSGVEEHR